MLTEEKSLKCFENLIDVRWSYINLCNQVGPNTESRQDHEEGDELDSHKEVRQFCGPGKIKRREVALKRSKAGRWSWAQKVGLLLLQLLLNSSATDTETAVA